MSNLATTIRQMLSRKEAVILPGFGSLLITEGRGTTSGAGRIDPPGLIIRFDATHPKGDGKLAQEFAEGEEIEYEEARQQVLELVDAIKFSLDKGEAHHMEDVGTFTRDDNNKIHFQKDPDWTLDPSLFGLSSLELLELEDEGVASSGKTTPESAEDPGISEQESSVEKVPVSGKPGAVATPPRARRRPVNKWGIIWIVIGSLAAVLVIILLIPTNNDIEIGKDGIVIKDAETEDRQDPDLLQEADAAGDAGLYGDVEEGGAEITDAVGPIVTEAEEFTTEQSDENQNRYFIIGGSFQKLPNATDLMNQLKSAGFPAEIIITENRLYRVSVKSYPTRDEAFNSLDDVKENAGLESVWVMTR